MMAVPRRDYLREVVRDIVDPTHSPLSSAHQDARNRLLERLSGLVDLHCWAMQWTIYTEFHRWPDGKQKHFVLWREDLVRLGLDTVEQLLEIDWLSPGATICLKESHLFICHGYTKAAKLLRRDDGTIAIRSINANKTKIDVDGLPTFDVERDFVRHADPVFDGDDYVWEVWLGTDVNVVPWDFITSALVEDYNAARPHLKAAGVDSDGPLSKQFGNGSELLDNARKQKTEPEELLLDLDQHRLARVEDIDKAQLAELRREATGGETTGGEVVKHLRVQVDREAATIIIDGQEREIRGSRLMKDRIASFFDDLINADGVFIKRPDNIRTRNIAMQHRDVSDLIDARRGAGSQIPREKLWT